VTTRKFRLIFTWLMIAPQCVARVVPESWPLPLLYGNLLQLLQFTSSQG
jgi:hypothetical protein